MKLTMDKIDIVLGLGFGDEGKGNVVNALSTDQSLIIRFNGGHQAGHTVIENDKQHIFSSIGSGAMKGAKTYLSRFCTINPTALENEIRVLEFKPHMYIDSDTMVTTPYDIEYNISMDKLLKHGTVGVGFGATIQRNENNYKLFARDLLTPTILELKLEAIEDYYRGLGIDVDKIKKKYMNPWKISVKKLTDGCAIIDNIKEIPYYWKHLIFEGAQGILLDMDYGFFPHVTRSNTTSKNIFTLFNEWDIPFKCNNATTFYVTRAYSTRHGAGPIINEDISFEINNPNEANKSNGIQGEFRYGTLDLNTIEYAVSCDKKWNKFNNSTLVVTCLDQVNDGEGTFFMVDTYGTSRWSPASLADILEMDEFIECNTPSLKL